MISAISAESENKTQPVKITLANGNLLSGNTIATTENALLRLTSEHLQKPAKLKLAQILAVELNLPPLPATKQPQVLVHFHPRFRVAQGDSISGELLGIEKQHITLDTASAGTLKIKRRFVKSIENLIAGKEFYRGPRNAKDWDSGNGKVSWQFKNGTLFSKADGGIGRDVKLAPMSHVSFQAKRERTMRFRVQLYSNDYKDNSPEAQYDLHFNRSYAYMRTRGKARDKTTSIVSGRWKQLSATHRQDNAKFDLFTDRKKGTVRIFINGVAAATLQSQSPDPTNLGTGIRFVAEERYPIQISKIKVQPWDGKTLPLPPNEDAKKSTTLTTHALLVDTKGDKHPFSILKKDEQHFILSVLDKPEKNSRVAIKEVAKFLVTHEDASQPKMNTRDILCHFQGGSSITLQLKQIQNGKLTAFSQPLGETTFDLRAFSAIDFNIYNHQQKP